MQKTSNPQELAEIAKKIRRHIIEMIGEAKSGHPGGSLSAVEIFVSLYGEVMNHRPQEPLWEGRDRLVVSKGHITPVVYVTLANFGYFPTTWRQWSRRRSLPANTQPKAK